MMKHLTYTVGLLIVCPFLTFSQTTYYSQGPGSWDDVGRWNTEPDGSGTTLVESGSPYGDSLANFIIQEGDEVTLDGRTQVNNLTVPSTGKLYRGSGTLTYVEVYGAEINIEGQLGDGNANDGISLEINGAACEITGNGQVDLKRLRKGDESTEAVTDLTISTDINLRYGDSRSNYRTALYNNATSQAFDLTIASGATVSVLGDGTNPGSISIDGTSGVSGTFATERLYGTFTINGTLVVSGDVFFRTDNNDVASTAGIDEGNISFIVNGTLKVGGEIIGNSTGDGDGVASLQLNSGSTLELSGATNFIDIHPDNNEVLIDAHATIVYAGSSTQQIFEGITYGDLKLSGGGDKELTSDIIVSNTLILESGDVLTGANKLIVESTASDAIQGGSENSYVVGNLQRAVDASTTYAFPIGQGGDADGYNPFTLEVMAGLSGTETVEASFTSAMETIDEERTCETDEGTQRLSYACAVGNWDITSNDFSYEITLQPSAATQADCPNEGVSLFPSIRKVEGGDQSLGCNEGIADVPFNSFSTFSIAYAASAVAAPVELLGFDVEAQGTAAVLWWATATETNNSHFEIERSSDGFSYEVIARVEGMGTAFEAQEYSYTDSMAGPGWHYYRLKQVDLNGEYEYFSIREVELSGRSSLQAAVLIGYPNPADNYYKMEMEIPDPKNAMIKVFDLRGNQIYHAMIANCASGYNAIEMDVSTWQSGIYMYMITAGADVIRGKIVKT